MTPETQALIERLAGEADAYAHTLYQLRGEQWHKVRDAKFAELVARDLETFVYMDTNLRLAIGGDGIEAVATAIRQRFGVGE